MLYQISFQENPPEARLTVDGKEDCVMLSRSVPITEGTTKEELHDIGLRMVIEQEEAFAKYDAEQAEKVSLVAKVQELTSAFEKSVEVTEKEVTEKKAEIAAIEVVKLQAIEDERIAKEEAEAQAAVNALAEAAALKAKEEVVETPVERVIVEEPIM